MGGKTCPCIRKKFLENTLKFSEFLKLSEEIILWSKKYVECFLINDFFSFAFLYAYLQVIYGPNSKFLNTYSKYSLHFEGKNIKYQKYWKLCSKSWFYVDIFLSWIITATHIDFSPNLSIENRYLCIKNSKMQGQNKKYLCLSIHRVKRNISLFRQKNIDLANFSIVDSAVMIWVINLSHLMNSEVEVEEWPL